MSQNMVKNRKTFSSKSYLKKAYKNKIIEVYHCFPPTAPSGPKCTIKQGTVSMWSDLRITSKVLFSTCKYRLRLKYLFIVFPDRMARSTLFCKGTSF